MPEPTENAGAAKNTEPTKNSEPAADARAVRISALAARVDTATDTATDTANTGTTANAGTDPATFDELTTALAHELTALEATLDELT